MTKPPPGTMVWWRFKRKESGRFHFGYCTYERTLLRMGNWNGDITGGTVVEPAEIEWRKY